MSIHETFHSSTEERRRLTIWLWVAGVAAIVLGAIGIVFPFVMTLAAELLFGAVLATLGLLQIVRAFFNGGVESRLWSFLFGAIALAAGVLLLLYPLEGMLTLTIVLASFFLVGGAAKLAGAWQLNRLSHQPDLPRMGGIGWLTLSGVLSVALGVLLFIGLPVTATWALGLLLGIDLFLLGIAEIALAIGISKAEDR